jgi:hypothetical protein
MARSVAGRRVHGGREGLTPGGAHLRGTSFALSPYMAKYGKKAQSKVKRAMHERKRGTLRSGRSGKRVTSRKQAIAIGLSEARRAGGKVPRKRKGGKKR